MIFVVVTLLMVSLLLIAQYHLALISPSVRSLSCITLSHLRTQIKYADSDRRIWKSWVGPWCVIFHCLHWLFLLTRSSRRVMLPHPSIVPSIISGQGMFRCGHRVFASNQMSCVFLSLQCIRMWLIDSVSLQVVHNSLSSHLLMFPQYFLTRWVPWIDLYRNCCMIGLIVFFQVLFHIAAFVSDLPVIFFMAKRVSCAFFVVVLLALCCFHSRIPLYAVACIRVASFAPWTSSSLGMSRFRGSGCCLFAPCFASASLLSFPSFPLWPFTHCMVILADLCLIRWATFLKNLAFFC